MATKKDNTEALNITPIEIKTVKIRIQGDSPLIVHAWSTKAKQMMLDAQMGKTKTKARDKKNPVEDFIESMYWLDGKPTQFTEEAFNEAVLSGKARWGFPVTAIKQAANSAAYRMGWAKNQMGLRGSYFIKGTDGDLVEIKGSIPEPREDMVRVGNGAADIRYRGEFKNWYMDLEIAYNSNGEWSLEQIINCINAGGFACGIGEWRPEKDGSFGMFHVVAI